MPQIMFSGNIYNLHPIYDQYASSKGGHVIDIAKKSNSHGNFGIWWLFVF